MKLSIVTTLYKSSPYVDEFYKRASAEAKKITDDYEIIFVEHWDSDDRFRNLAERTYKKLFDKNNPTGVYRPLPKERLSRFWDNTFRILPR